MLRPVLFQIHDLPKPKYFCQSIYDLSIGSYKNIEVGHHSMPIIEALRKFVDNRISALPIVDDDGKLIDIYAKFDVIVSQFCLINKPGPGLNIWQNLSG